MKRPTKAQAMDFALVDKRGEGWVTLIFAHPPIALRVHRYADRTELLIDRRTLQQAAELAKEVHP